MVIHESSPIFPGPSLRLRNEAITCGEQSMDLHISKGVFEHVMNPAQACAEIVRALKATLFWQAVLLSLCIGDLIF
jgi:hypothetical protein